MTDQPQPESQPNQPAQPPFLPDQNLAQQPFSLASLAPQRPMQRSRKPIIIAVAAGVAVVLLCCGIGAASLISTGAEINEASQKASASPTTRTSSPTTAPTTASPSPTVSPSPTAASPSPSPSPTAKPKVIKGRGDDVVDIPPLTEFSIVEFKCPKCTGNTVLRSDGPEGLLVNEIGAYSGKRWINLYDDSLTTQFEIEAAGSWTLTIGSVEQLATMAPTGKASGKGDDVVLLGGTATKAKITHSKGSSNFAIHAYSLDTGEGGLLVNEIGGYSGTRPLQAPAIVQVTADGNWTITPA